MSSYGPPPIPHTLSYAAPFARPVGRHGIGVLVWDFFCGSFLMTVIVVGGFTAWALSQGGRDSAGFEVIFVVIAILGGIVVNAANLPAVLAGALIAKRYAYRSASVVVRFRWLTRVAGMASPWLSLICLVFFRLLHLLGNDPHWMLMALIGALPP